jgi:ubiquinone/menaquinone biosynthesis C-methylase UbiE
VRQRDVFLQSEGDAWFSRNASILGSRKLPDSDSVLLEILALPAAEIVTGTRVLEIGCGDGTRLSWLRQNRGFECHGVDPSGQAVEVAKSRSIDAHQGTADSLAFVDAHFDIVMFGFCLYLCDRTDLFRIISEADRVLKDPGWLLILDFYSATPTKRAYHHRSGVFTYKMDYRTLFTWHPAYSCYAHKVCAHAGGGYTDDASEWVATSVLRKKLKNDD